MCSGPFFVPANRVGASPYYTVQGYSGRVPPPLVDQLPLSVPVFHILLSLVDEDRHGYAIIKDIEARTGGEVRLTASTLYGAVARLLDARLIEELEPEAGHERRRPYRLTRAGRRLLEAEAARLARATGWAAAKRLLPQAKGAGS
jgi:DNA-binding PadR family transcriptional regulator